MDIGAELRNAREAKGLSIRALAERTRIQPRTLAAIELNNIAAIPPRPSGRGFVRAFAEEVNLDPERTVHSYFSQFPATSLAAGPPALRYFERAEASPYRPSPWASLGTAATILLVVVVTAIMAGRRNAATSETAAVGTTGAATPAPTTTTPSSAPAVARPDAQAPVASVPSAPAPPLRFAFTVSRQCWVDASTDGTRVLYRILEPGESHTLDAQQAIAMRIGDAGAVAWTLNGRQGTPLGNAGAVRDLRITPDNAATLR